MIDIEKNYQIATALVGEKGKDLVHHCFLLLNQRGINLESLRYPDTYFYRTMISSLHEKRGTFPFRHNSKIIHSNAASFDIEDKKESNERVGIANVSPDAVNDILQELVQEGFKEELTLFLEVAKGKSLRQVSRETKLDINTVRNWHKIVKEEILRRYEYNTTP